MKLEWQDLPKPMSAFTTRNAEMIDLDKKKIVQYYSANTKIRVVQKCITPQGAYYRTESAKENGLNWAFEASAFGLPNEKAPLALDKTPPKEKTHTTPPFNPTEKQTVPKETRASESGERPKRQSLWRRLFGRKHG